MQKKSLKKYRRKSSSKTAHSFLTLKLNIKYQKILTRTFRQNGHLGLFGHFLISDRGNFLIPINTICSLFDFL